MTCLTSPAPSGIGCSSRRKASAKERERQRSLEAADEHWSDRYGRAAQSQTAARQRRRLLRSFHSKPSAAALDGGETGLSVRRQANSPHEYTCGTKSVTQSASGQRLRHSDDCGIFYATNHIVLVWMFTSLLDAGCRGQFTRRCCAIARRRWGAGGLSGSIQGLHASSLRQLSPGG